GVRAGGCVLEAEGGVDRGSARGHGQGKAGLCEKPAVVRVQSGCNLQPRRVPPQAHALGDRAGPVAPPQPDGGAVRTSLGDLDRLGAAEWLAPPRIISVHIPCVPLTPLVRINTDRGSLAAPAPP